MAEIDEGKCAQIISKILNESFRNVVIIAKTQEIAEAYSNAVINGLFDPAIIFPSTTGGIVFEKEFPYRQVKLTASYFFEAPSKLIWRRVAPVFANVTSSNAVRFSRSRLKEN